MISNLRNKTFI